MISKVISRNVNLAVVAGLAVGLAGCRVHVDKDDKGQDKTVQVDTPFGGVHVNTDQTTASDLGLPVYPGAQLAKDKDKGNHKSADVHLGFGQWQLRVKAVSYESHDSQDKIEAFYKKALGRYGDVIVCQGSTPQGTPTVTAEGLTCEEDKSPKVQIDRGDYNLNKNSLELKAGSKRRQHIVGFEESAHDETRFTLVALELPAFVEGRNAGKSD